MRSHRKGFTLIELLVAITVISILTAALMPVLRSAKEAGNSAKCLSNLRQLYLANVLYAENHDGKFVLAAEDIHGPGGGLKRWHGTRPTPTDPFDPALGPLASYLGRDGKIKQCPSFRDYIVGFEVGGGGYGYNEVYVGGRGDLFDIGFDPNSATHSLSLNDHQAWNLSKLVMFSDTAMPRATPQGQAIAEYSFTEPPYWESPPGTVTSVESSPSTHFRHNDRANVIWCDGHASREKMSYTSSLNVYGGDNNKFKVGWFGPRTDNACWKSE